MTAFEILQKHHDYIQKNGEKPSEYEEDRILAAMEEYAALRIHDVVGRSEQFKCAMQLSKSGKRCNKQCVECELSYKNYSI
jgi:hypothetical protein